MIIAMSKVFPALRFICGKQLYVLRCTRNSPLSLKDSSICYKFLVSHSVGFSSKKNDIGQTTILIQDGVNIQELPLIVRKVRDVVFVCNNDGEAGDEISIKFNGANDKHSSLSSGSKSSNGNNPKDKETKEIIEGFRRCLTIKSLLALLETVPACEVTPDVALCALEKLIQLENNKGFRNLITPETIDISKVDNGEENFTRAAVFNKLVDVIIEGNDTSHIIECLKILGKETVRANVASYRNRLCMEILVRATDGLLTIEQLCQAVKTFSLFAGIDQKSADGGVEADKLWVGISGRQAEISASNVVELFSILSYLKRSRKAVLSILERRMAAIWWELRPSCPPKILSYLLEAGLTSSTVESTVTRWAHANARLIQDEHLQDIVENLLKLEHVDSQIIGAMDRHCAKSGWSAFPPMAATAARYCSHFRIRSLRILTAISDILVKHGQEIPPGMVRDLIWSLAFLSYAPPETIWKVLDEVLEERFAQFSSVDILDVLLACIILGRPPLNAARKIYTLSYIDRALTSAEAGRKEAIKAKLRLVDAALSVEWPRKWQQGMPILARQEISVWQDGRVKRAARRIAEVLDADLGSKSGVDVQVRPGRPLPIGELHMVDVIIHSGKKVWPLNRNERTVALLIHLPEHYCRDSTVLIGPQMLRIRHLRLVGYYIATVDYSKLSRLWVHPSAFLEYVNERVKSALDPLPKVSNY